MRGKTAALVGISVNPSVVITRTFKEIREHLDAKYRGVYSIRDSLGTPIYIGMTTVGDSRILSHLQKSSSPISQYIRQNKPRSLGFDVVVSAYDASRHCDLRAMEREAIAKNNPWFNVDGRSSRRSIRPVPDTDWIGSNQTKATARDWHRHLESLYSKATDAQLDDLFDLFGGFSVRGRFRDFMQPDDLEDFFSPVSDAFRNLVRSELSKVPMPGLDRYGQIDITEDEAIEMVRRHTSLGVDPDDITRLMAIAKQNAAYMVLNSVSKWLTSNSLHQKGARNKP